LADLELATHVVALALEAGATQADATATVAERFSVEARDASVEKLEQSIGRSITLRAFVAGARATLSTTDLSTEGLRDFVRETVDAARFVGADEYGGIPETASYDASRDGELELYADDVRSRGAEQKIEDALALERLIRRHDSRIVNSRGSHVADSIATISLANSHGFASSYRCSSASLDTSPIAADGDAKRIGSYGTAARGYGATFSTDMVATRAVAQAVGGIGARKPATMRGPVIFERDVAARVLGDLFTALSASNVAIGNSFFAERIGEKLGSDRVTLVDDGRLPRGLGTSPFDAEGVPTQRTIVFERGILRSFLFDTYYARRLGAKSTGNAAGGAIGPNNFYLEAGDRSVEALIAGTPRGVFVVDMIGFSTESVTGTYSRGARGFAIENGELAYPIDEFTIAGNLIEMLAAIDGVANDLVFDGSIVSPAFRVAEMTISGSYPPPVILSGAPKARSRRTPTRGRAIDAQSKDDSASTARYALRSA
jgi:PmbA protein